MARIHPKIRRQKAAELLQKAKELEYKRFAEIGELFVSSFLSGKKQNGNGNFDEFRRKAEGILNKSSKKQQNPSEIKAASHAMVQAAIDEENDRKKLIGEKLLELLKQKPKEGDNKLMNIHKMAIQIWQD